MPIALATAAVLALGIQASVPPPPPAVETAVSTWASATVTPASPGRWRADVSIGEEVSGGARRVVVDVMLTRRTCDVAGCIDTVLRTQPSAVDVTFAAGLASVRATGTSVSVMVRRHSADGQQVTVIEDRVMALPLDVTLTSAGGELRSWFRAVGGGTRTVTRSLQVAATARISLGSVRLATSQASMNRSRRVTTVWPAAPR